MRRAEASFNPIVSTVDTGKSSSPTSALAECDAYLLKPVNILKPKPGPEEAGT